ncbi:MAG: aminoacyl-tRNA hydrolase [Candidatus Krumholzibacteriota bacterium]|nr:aminoacyl-tRNA hydrolase [Candidatus Krumholzibacteriota bacterium]
MAGISFLCGLGNPGKKYARTRHNLGFMTLDLIARRHKLIWSRGSRVALESRWEFAGRGIVLIKPQTWMNSSGEALSEYDDPIADSLLVICDDMNLPLGQIRIRSGGGSGGHRGLDSISAQLGTTDYARLRMGVGSPPAGREWSDYVLEPFSPAEEEAASILVETASRAVETIIQSGLSHGQQEFNHPDPPVD